MINTYKNKNCISYQQPLQLIREHGSGEEPRHNFMEPNKCTEKELQKNVQIKNCKWQMSSWPNSINSKNKLISIQLGQPSNVYMCDSMHGIKSVMDCNHQDCES